MSNHAKEQKGYCERCKIVLHWTDLPQLARAACPRCKTPLARTKPSTRGEHVNERPATQPPAPVFACVECGRKFRTVKAAEKAAFGPSGCPRCGGADIQETA